MANFSSLHHSFDISLAQKYGIDEAIVIHHFQHWISVNQRLKRNLHDEKTWTYQSSKEIAAHYPYWTPRQVQRIIRSLIRQKVLIAKNYNKTAMDKTPWYAFVNEDEFLSQIKEKFTMNPNGRIDEPKRSHRRTESGSSSPNENLPPYAYPDAETISLPKGSNEPSPHSVRLSEFFLQSILKMKPNFTKRPTQKWHKDCQSLLKFRKEEEIQKVLIWALKDSFWSKNVQSPHGLFNNLDKIEVAMQQTSSRSLEQLIEQNEQLAKKIKEKYNDNRDIELGRNYLEFNFGRDRMHLNFSRKDFKEQAEIALKRMNLNYG